jgi:hypothetical protein
MQLLRNRPARRAKGLPGETHISMISKFIKRLKLRFVIWRYAAIAQRTLFPN